MELYSGQREFATPNELDCFSNLLLRWPYDTPRKLFINLSNYSFYLYELTEYLLDINNNTAFRLKPHTDNSDKFEYFIENYEYLFFIKDEIASTEERDKTLALRPAHIIRQDRRARPRAVGSSYRRGSDPALHSYLGAVT